MGPNGLGGLMPMHMSMPMDAPKLMPNPIDQNAYIVITHLEKIG